MSQLKASVERSPLNLLDLDEVFAERRNDTRDFGFPMPKGEMDGLGQLSPGEVKLPGEQPDVVEILHPAVQFAEFHHGFKLLCNSTFTTVTKQLWRRKTQQCWQLGLWRMKHKLMQVMYERENSTRLSGRVEVDDAYLGGENPGGKAGRGSENKVPFIAAVQTNDKHNPLYVVFSKVKTFSHAEVKAWANRLLVPATTVVSDGLWCFQSVTQTECIQQREIVGPGRKSTDMECFSWVNTILGNLKNAITGTYTMPSTLKNMHTATWVNINIVSTVASISLFCYREWSLLRSIRANALNVGSA